MPDYDAANDVADKIFALIADDNQLSPEITPNEILTIATQIVISVLRSIDDPCRREYAANLVADKIRSLPELWRDEAKVVFH